MLSEVIVLIILVLYMKKRRLGEAKQIGPGETALRGQPGSDLEWLLPAALSATGRAVSDPDVCPLYSH